MWCPHCKAQLTELETLCESFVAAGVQPIAASADTSDRANVTRLELGLEKVELGYEMPIETARDLGVFISFGINDREMPLFCEPASFLISSKNRIQAAWVASNALAHAHAGSSGLRQIHKGAPRPRTARFRLTRRLAELLQVMPRRGLRKRMFRPSGSEKMQG